MVSGIQSTPRVLWVQVMGLALVQGAIALMWLIYNLYLGDLLSQFGFSAVFITGILLLENSLAMVMEPLMGSYSDRAQRWLGSRFPFIALGVILASGVLMAVAALVTFGQPVGLLRWLLPILLVAWALAMTVFRSPALSLLGRYAYGSGLPQAASVLTVTGALIGALGPMANQYILSLGPPIAFGVASLLMLAAAATLRAVNPEHSIKGEADNPADRQRGKLSMLSLLLIFVTGCGISLGSRLILTTLPRLLATIPDLNVALTMGGIFIAIAVTAIPAGLLAQWIGNRRAMLVGLGGISLLLLGLNWVQQAGLALGIAIAMGALLSLVRNGTLPFALSMVPTHKAGLGVGLFFSGAALASNLFGIFFKQPDAVNPMTALGVAGLGLIVAGLAIAISQRLSGTSSRLQQRHH